MVRSIEQKLETLAGLQRQIDNYLKELEDNNLHYTMHRVKEELVHLLHEIEELNRLANKLAHSVAISTQAYNIHPYAEESYKEWEQRHANNN